MACFALKRAVTGSRFGQRFALVTVSIRRGRIKNTRAKRRSQIHEIHANCEVWRLP